ncbi:MAG: HD domain-containing protein [Kiritimatiellaeota bacterium]|nr:HD domain-containing protein [Kiritimatiellota bacterium]
MKLTDCKPGDRLVNIPLLVKSAAVSKTKTGKDFLEAEITDGESSVRSKFWDWDTTRETPQAGAVFVFTGRCEEFAGTAQIIISSIEPAPPGEDDPLRFLPRAPRPIDEMLADINSAIQKISDENIRDIVAKMVDDNMRFNGFATAPASQRLHHAEIGGLLHHITDMLRVARALPEVYPFLDPDLLIAGVIIHDIGKLRELSINNSGLADDYTPEGRLLGHLIMGAQALRETAAELGVTCEKVMLLEHMILSHHGQREFGSPVIPQIPEALVLHMLDSLDAKMFQSAAALAGVKPGAFSAKVFALDNRQLYKPEINC